MNDFQPPYSDPPPTSPFDDRPISAAKEVLPDDVDPPYLVRDDQRAGCGPLGFALVLIALFGLAIVVLAGAAGWTNGTREASQHATSTQQAAIAEQLTRVPDDVLTGNTVLLSARLEYLATLTPGAPGIDLIMQTATSLALTRQPTATLTPTATASATPSPTMTATLDPSLPTPTAGPAYDLARLLSEAQGSFASGSYSEAADLAEAIQSVDPSYEAATVRGILADSLTALARSYYNAMQPAAGNRIVGRMESLGLPVGDLSYERTVGEVYLNAISSIGISFPSAIAALEELVGYGQGRYYSEAIGLLADQYLGYGDALAFDPAFGYCPAAIQYRNAYNLTGSGTAGAKLNDAENMCANATPTFDPLLLGTPGVIAPGAIAPVGAPGG